MLKWLVVILWTLMPAMASANSFTLTPAEFDSCQVPSVEWGQVYVYFTVNGTGFTAIHDFGDPDHPIIMVTASGTGQASSLFAGIARPLVEESTQGIVQVAAGSGWVYGLPPAQPVETKRELIRTVLPHLENTLVQQGNTIYLIESSQRRGFKNLADFFSYGLSLSSVVTANIADLSLPEGLLMSAKPGILARDYWDGKLYYLNQTLEKQLISTKRAIKRWTASFPQVPTLDLSGYFLGKSITK
jgi:hypothetical protein